MKRAFTPGLKVQRMGLLRKRRELSARGEILKKIGEQVAHSDIVARATLPGDLQIMRLAERLGITPAEAIRGLKVQVGNQVKVGDLLCEHAGLFGWFKSHFKSPTAGIVDFVAAGTGHIGIREEARHVELSAYISGEVVQVEAEKSVTIETNAALAQGIFGVGGERIGTLRSLQISPDQPIGVEHIPDGITGAVLFGGRNPNAAALGLASSRGAVGFITGSVDDAALVSFLGYDLGIAMTGDEDISMTLIITEGFGNLAMSQRVHDLLSELEGKSASLNGATQVRAGAVRPEVIVSNLERPSMNQTESDEGFALTIGSRVRIIRFPYFGELAKVLALPHALQEIETGALTRVLKAELQNGQIVVVPRANVEMVA